MSPLVIAAIAYFILPEDIISEEKYGPAGYDPIFYVGDVRLAEMDLVDKNKISHRACSMRALKKWLDSH
jgi:inosine/xanthosine triphosphate pyrophosphatase family protein